MTFLQHELIYVQSNCHNKKKIDIWSMGLVLVCYGYIYVEFGCSTDLMDFYKDGSEVMRYVKIGYSNV